MCKAEKAENPKKSRHILVKKMKYSTDLISFFVEQKFYLFLLVFVTPCSMITNAQLLESNRSKSVNEKLLEDKPLVLEAVEFKSQPDTVMKIAQVSNQKAIIDSLKKNILEARNELLELQKRAANDKIYQDAIKKLTNDITSKSQELEILKKNTEEDFKIIQKLITEKHRANYSSQTKTIQEFRNSLNKLKDQLSINKRLPETNKQFEIQHFLDSAYFSLSQINDSLLRRVNDISTLVKSYEKEIEKLSKASSRELLVTNDADKLNAAVNGSIVDFGKDFKVFSTLIAVADVQINSKREAYVEKAKSSDFEAIPGLAAVFGQREVVPNITILGSRKFDSKSDKDNSMYGELKFFTGAVASNKEVTKASSLFIVETSSFGFTSNFSYGFVGYKNGKVDDSKKVGINFSINYLGKNLQPDTLNNFSVSLFLGKVGGEYLFVNKGSVYFNWCGMVVIDEIEKFEKHYNNETQLKTYSEIGARFFLDLSSDANLSLKVDLNFIYQNERIKEIAGNKDLFIPNIRIGLVRKIGD